MNDIGMQVFEFLVALAGIKELSELLVSLHELDQSIKNTLSVVGGFTIVFGILQCFLGYKLFKVWCGFIGFLVGGIIGLMLYASGVFAGSIILQIAGFFIILLLACTGAYVAYRAYLVGVFIYAAVTAFLVFFILIGLITNTVNTGLIGGFIAGVIFGVIAVIFRRFWIIATTSVSGGITIGTSLMMITQSTESIWSILVPLLFIAAGFVIQYTTVKKSPQFRGGVKVISVQPSQPPPVYVNVAAQGTQGQENTSGTSATPATPTTPVEEKPPQTSPDADTEPLPDVEKTPD